MFDAYTNIPLHTIFVFFLIISANYLGQLYPCKIQTLFETNVYIKHFFGFLTLVFFVVLVDPIQTSNFNETIMKSIVLYGIFLILMNTNVLFFVFSLISLAGIYLLSIKKIELSSNTDNDSLILYDRVHDLLYIFFALSTIVGFFVYMGEKKIEYKNKFDYFTFIFGKPSCKGFSPKTKYMQSFLAAFR